MLKLEQTKCDLQFEGTLLISELRHPFSCLCVTSFLKFCPMNEGCITELPNLPNKFAKESIKEFDKTLNSKGRNFSFEPNHFKHRRCTFLHSVMREPVCNGQL